MTTDLRSVKASHFLPYLHQQLKIRFNEKTILPAELIEVKETENYLNAERTPFFMVLRTAAKDRYFQQGIYTLEHPDSGGLSLFLVPLGPDGHGMLYEAVFS